MPNKKEWAHSNPTLSFACQLISSCRLAAKLPWWLTDASLARADKAVRLTSGSDLQASQHPFPLLQVIGTAYRIEPRVIFYEVPNHIALKGACQFDFICSVSRIPSIPLRLE